MKSISALKFALCPLMNAHRPVREDIPQVLFDKQTMKDPTDNTERYTVCDKIHHERTFSDRFKCVKMSPKSIGTVYLHIGKHLRAQEENIYFSSASKRNFTSSKGWNTIVIFNKEIIHYLHVLTTCLQFHAHGRAL
jgi:hypothetical protein